MYPTQIPFQDSSPRISKKAIPPRINFGLITRVQASVLGVLPAPITLAVPIPLLPRPPTTLALASYFVESSAAATVEQPTDDNADFYVISWDSWECHKMSAFQKVTLFLSTKRN